ncbi:hypothetical protein ACA31_00235 [Staphylococcus sp. NAM3COL9]|nr:hypothetical protein ACA31_00235 [Staphylococcus sp. NAM3COL9]
MKKIAIISFLLTGSLHSLATFYWSFGGELGLLTVGNWTISLKQTYDNKFLLILFLLGIFKISSTWIPLILNYKNNKFINTISYIGATILVIHGGINTISGWLKLLGIIPIEFKLSLIGQAFVWDPMFLIWGTGLIVFLRLKDKI